MRPAVIKCCIVGNGHGVSTAVAIAGDVATISVTKTEQSITATAGENAGGIIIVFKVPVAVTISPAFTPPGLTVRVHSPVARRWYIYKRLSCTGTPASSCIAENKHFNGGIMLKRLDGFQGAIVSPPEYWEDCRVMPPAKLQLMLFWDQHRAT